MCETARNLCDIARCAHPQYDRHPSLSQAGSTTLKVVLSPGFEEAVMVPPCRVTICLQILNPMPEPLVLVVKNGTKMRSITSSIIPTQLYSISDIQTVSYCRGYLSGTVQASDTSLTIRYLQDLFYLKSIDFKPQQDNLHQPLYI